MHTAVFCFLFYSFYDILIEQLTISLIGTVHIAGGEHRSLHAMLLQQLDKSSHHTLCKEASGQGTDRSHTGCIIDWCCRIPIRSMIVQNHIR